MTHNWAEQAIEISRRFDALIIPLYSKRQPGIKAVNPTLPKHADLDPEQKPSNDENIIRNWASRCPGYGVIPGDKFLIVDIDVKEGQHGKECLKFLKDKGLPIDTYLVKSPSGGLHLYYQHPYHYKPSQGSDGTTKFEDPIASQEWDAMRALQGDSSGIDTRYGWGYVAGPGSDFDGEIYEILNSADMAAIPSSIQIGVKGGVSVERPKAATKTDLMDVVHGSIKDNRNDYALDWTFKLSLQRLPDSAAQLMIRESLLFYNDADGEAPTYEEVWDMYERAKMKEGDVTNELLYRYVYLVKGRRVMDTQTGEIMKLEEFQGAYTGKKIPIETTNGVRMMNPVKIWEDSSDRLIVHDEMFDIGQPHGIVDIPLQKGVSQYFNKFIPPINLSFDNVTETAMGKQIGAACIQVIENIISSPYDRDWFRKWIGQMLFDPGTRPAWHWHIYSNARGIGKDTLASIITTLYGSSNVARFGTEAFEDKSNTEFFNCGLGIMSDFSPISGQGGKSKVLAQFKSLTGAGTGRMRAMYMDGQQRAVSLRFLMLSNSYNDFPVDNEDRRLFKCESTGKTLHHRVYALTHIFTDPERVTQDMIDQYGIPFTERDRAYAQALLLDYFRESGYEEMATQFDCPYNDIKDDNKATTVPKHIESIRRAIEHKLFTFAADIVTRDMLALYLESIKVQTSPDTVLQDLRDQGILKEIRRKTKRNTGRAFTVETGMVIYDEDLRILREVGSATVQRVFCCRNYSHWGNMDVIRRPKAELSKILNYPNIKDGWNEKHYHMIKRNVVPIDNDSK